MVITVMAAMAEKIRLKQGGITAKIITTYTVYQKHTTLIQVLNDKEKLEGILL